MSKIVEKKVFVSHFFVVAQSITFRFRHFFFFFWLPPNRTEKQRENKRKSINPDPFSSVQGSFSWDSGFFYLSFLDEKKNLTIYYRTGFGDERRKTLSNSILQLNQQQQQKKDDDFIFEMKNEKK